MDRTQPSGGGMYSKPNSAGALNVNANGNTINPNVSPKQNPDASQSGGNGKTVNISKQKKCVVQ